VKPIDNSAMNDVSIDIETLGKTYNAPIISIGAVVFDRTTGKLGKTFYQEIAIDSAIKSGKVDGSTLAWWLRQDAKTARRIFEDTSAEQDRKLDLASTLLNFTTWFRSVGTGAARPWGNGSTFDVTIIEHALDVGSIGLSPPWAYFNIRDMRTIVDVAQMVADFRADSIERKGIAHNALDDAVHQAAVISSAWAALCGYKASAAVTGKLKKPARPVDDDDL